MTIARFDDLEFLGDPRLADESRKGELKVIVYQTRRAVVESKFGPSVVRDIASKLSGEAKRLWTEPPLPTAWVSIAPLIEIDRILVRDHGGGDLALMRDLARRGAQEELNVVYRFLLKLGTPAFVMKRMSVVFGSKARPGKLEEAHASADGSELTLTGMVLPRYYCSHVMPAWAALACELTGARAVQTEQTECVHRGDPLCRWVVKWRA